MAWPTRTQTTVFTAFVIGLSLILSLYLGVADLLFTRGVSMIVTGQVGATEHAPSVLLDEVATGTLPVAPIEFPVQ